MKKTALALAIILAGLSAAAAEAPFRRGIGIHDLMNWGALEPGRPDRYRAAPYAGKDHEPPEALLRAVAAAGFDFVRLTVDPGPMLQLAGPARDALDARLVGLVAKLQALGLGVVVDLHGNTQVKAYDPIAVTAAADSPLFRDYVALVARTARLLAGLNARRLAFELMNEPPYGYESASVKRWQGMLETLHAAARAAAPTLTLVLTGAHGGDREGLLAIDPAPFEGSDVLWSFHHYEPHDFTHQGVPNGDRAGLYRQYLSEMPYPSDSLPRAVPDAALRANVAADPGLDPATRRAVEREALAKVTAYLKAGASARTIARDFDAVAGWARRNSIPGDRVFLGEFGATRSYDDHRAADPLSYEAWIRDVRMAAERRGFGWAIWALTGTGGMALVSTDGGDALDGGSLRALGLKP